MTRYKLGEGPYGSAYQGTIDDLFGGSDLKPLHAKQRVFGLFLGQFDWEQKIRHVWRQPVKGIMAWLRRETVLREHTETLPQVHDVRFTGDQHHLVVASSGSGKFRDVLSNMLLYDGSCETACLIIDPKGEIASTVGPIIDPAGTLNTRTFILDPWNVTGVGFTECLTLLDGVRASNPHCVKDARVLAEAIVIQRTSDDGHWVTVTRSLLSALLLYLGVHEVEEGHRNLFRLRQLVTLPWQAPRQKDEYGEPTDEPSRPDFMLLLDAMCDSDLFGGIVARTAQAMLNRDPKERRIILSTLDRDTAFIEDPALWKTLKSSTIDIDEFVRGSGRLHVIVPFDYTQQMSSWLRLAIAAFYNACLRNQFPQHLPSFIKFRHIIIDEFAGLGKLDFIMNDIAQARGVGVKYHIAIQNFAQLKDLYKEGWENIISNCFIQAFGVTELFTAEYLSKMTGQATVVTKSTGTSKSDTTGTSITESSSTGSSSSSSHGPSGYSSTSGQSSSSGFSYTTSESETTGSSLTFSSTGRPILMPDEILRLPGDQQLLFMRGLPVFLTRRKPYYVTFEKFMKKRTLKDVIGSKKKSISIDVKPFQVGFVDASNRASVNSIMNVSNFVTPKYGRISFMRALLQSPEIIIATAITAGVAIIIAVAVMVFVIPGYLDKKRRAEQREEIINSGPEAFKQGQSGDPLHLDTKFYQSHSAYSLGVLSPFVGGGCNINSLKITTTSAIAAACNWATGSLLTRSNYILEFAENDLGPNVFIDERPLDKNGKPLQSAGPYTRNRGVEVFYNEKSRNFMTNANTILRFLGLPNYNNLSSSGDWYQGDQRMHLKACFVRKGFSIEDGIVSINCFVDL